MRRRPPRSTRTDTLLPSTTLVRSTEARMTEVALALLEGIDDDAVDFRDTYDGEGSEPVVLPANFPRSEEHTSELQSLMRTSYAVFCLKQKNSAVLTTTT